MKIREKCASRGAALVLLLALPGGVNRLNGQDHMVESEPAIDAIDRAWPEVNLNVVVLDKSGVPQKIDEQALQLFEDHTERPLRFPAADDSPVSLAILVDSSGSTYQQKPKIVSAVAAILHALPANSEVMAASFSDKAYIEFPFIPVSKVDFSFMERVPAAGPTALYDSVAGTEEYFIANAKYPRRALVVLSDGENNASQVRIGIAYGLMERPGAPMVYACALSKPSFFQTQVKLGAVNMNYLAKRGGGLRFNLDPDPADAAAQIVAAIRSQYALQFTSANPAHDGKRRKLEVRLRVKDMQIHALLDYFAPAK